MKIPATDIYKQYQSIKKEIDQAIKEVIKDSAYIGGRYVEAFEKDFADFCGTRCAISLNSGTDALYLSLRALGIKTGDEVIVPSFTFFATAEIVCHAGATPIFADIDPETYNIDPSSVEKLVSDKTKAIIPVDLFGQPAALDKIRGIAAKHRLFVIEDACQAVGAKIDNKVIGAVSDITCFSFYPSKNLGAYGDGGMVTTNNPAVAEELKRLRNHGGLIKYQNEVVGVNSRLDGLQAAILQVKLKHLNNWNHRRLEIARKYCQLLSFVPQIGLPPLDDKRTVPVFHQFTIRAKNGQRDLLKKYLDAKGIQAVIYYPTPVHQLKAMEKLAKGVILPETEKAAGEVLSLPIYPELTDREIGYITKSIIKFFV